MAIEIGQVVEGKVTGVTNFGAFIELPESKVGLVHISQVSHTYVKDIKEHLKIGDQVKVKVMAVNKEGKFDLSIKQATASPEGLKYLYKPKRRGGRDQKPLHPPGSFEDKITRFLKQSEEKLQDVKRNLSHKQEGKKKKFI